MTDLQQISAFYPDSVRKLPNFKFFALKENIILQCLEWLSSSRWIGKITFIGGTNLRLTKGIRRFSEDIDFDCKNLSGEDFRKMTDALIVYLRNCGYDAVAEDRNNPRLTAFRRKIAFPGILQAQGMASHPGQKFFVKIEAQDQGVDYIREPAVVSGQGFRFSFPSPSASVLLSMKIAAILGRAKGRDIYDAMFLWQMASPDMDFLREKCGIGTLEELKSRLSGRLAALDMKAMSDDFRRMAFNASDADVLVQFPGIDYICKL